MESNLSYKNEVEALGTPEGRARVYPILVSAGQDALSDVLGGMRHHDGQVRKWCAAFLDHFADSRCEAALVELLEDRLSDVRRLAVHAIGCQPCKLRPLGLDVVGLLLERALDDVSIRVRRAAVHMLGNQPPDERVAVALRAAIERERDRKWLFNAQWALGRHSEPSRKPCDRPGDLTPPPPAA